MFTLAAKSESLGGLTGIARDPGKLVDNIWNGKRMTDVAEDLTKEDNNWAKAGEIAEIGGAVATGAAIGTIFGPVGTVGGAVVGGVVGLGAGLINHWMDSTERGEGMLFGLIPPDKSVLNIENYLDDLERIFSKQSGNVFQSIIEGTSVTTGQAISPSSNLRTVSNTGSTTGNQNYGNIDDEISDYIRLKATG